MRTRLVLLLLALSASQAVGAEYIIPGVPNYDQDLFPVDDPPSEPGDCAPVACTMLHGYYDAYGWPALIPGGSNVASIDAVVSVYKVVLGYDPRIGVPISGWDQLFDNKIGDAIVAVTNLFDEGAAFSRYDEAWPSFPLMQAYMNNNWPCVLLVWPKWWHGYPDSYWLEGASGLTELTVGHAVTTVGWSDSNGHWVICNLGWSYATRGWFNHDGDDDWYVSQIAPGGYPSSDTYWRVLWVRNGAGSDIYRYCEVVPIQSYFFPGFRFDKWVGEVANVSDVKAPSTTIKMLANATVTATYVSQLTLTVANGSGSGAYDAGTKVAIVAIVPAGYRFLRWAGDTANVANVNSPSTTVKMLANCNLAATFVQQFRLTVGNGTGSGLCDSGAAVAIAADVPSGYRFDSWTGNTATVANMHAASSTITMRATCSVTATFVRQFTLTVRNGTGSGIYETGSAATIHAEVPEGFRVRWVGDVNRVAGHRSATTTITMLSDSVVTATFVKQCTLTVDYGTGSGTYDIGRAVDIRARGPSGFKFSRWEGDVTNVTSVKLPHTTITMWEDAEVTATFMLPGDVNGDGCVNMMDLLAVRGDLGQQGRGLSTDCAPPGHPDGIVNRLDLLVVSRNLGAGCRRH